MSGFRSRVRLCINIAFSNSIAMRAYVILTFNFEGTFCLSQVVCLRTCQCVSVLPLEVVNNLQITGCGCSCHTEVTVRHVAIAWPFSRHCPHSATSLSWPSASETAQYMVWSRSSPSQVMFCGFVVTVRVLFLHDGNVYAKMKKKEKS